MGRRWCESVSCEWWQTTGANVTLSPGSFGGLFCIFRITAQKRQNVIRGNRIQIFAFKSAVKPGKDKLAWPDGIFPWIGSVVLKRALNSLWYFHFRPPFLMSDGFEVLPPGFYDSHFKSSMNPENWLLLGEAEIESWSSESGKVIWAEICYKTKR